MSHVHRPIPARRMYVEPRRGTSIPTRIAGIPCRVLVTHYLRTPEWPGSPHTCDSADDYYGGVEMDFEVLDQRGRPADWLARKATDEDREQVERDVTAYMENEA